ncbi:MULTISPECIES: acyltransferase [unclassified Rhodococcus (in: high G+C Gram-positive bacteria)]|uniref:acyltransferase n=1 Tax=unclassified Rhodococcus (in: high G+C Gram-positive bacteria) TaxID=192944 RepID=UPI000903C051|nr:MULTISPECIES: acyltransferase [unclassified Rhodococcus (in: high G+C Gram-positive bacteria)]APE10995.1 acyltransferase [Rhodococcus sp. 2G]APE11053.1 acyltransferase [Rhodococcus sp. 2G]QXU53596.1 acyltransferase [Rhodococcus sp. LW-XY12]
MKLRAASALGSVALLLAACGSSDTADEPETSTTASGSVEVGSETPDLNVRGAVEVALGETATVVQNGVTVLEVSDTSLSTDECAENTTLPGEVTKQSFRATIAVGPESIPEWLWQSDFYYVDENGKIAKNTDTSDATPCTGGGSGAFIDLPPNSSADGRVTLDVPNASRSIGYHTTQGGNDIRIEWTLPEEQLDEAAADNAPTTTSEEVSAPAVEAPAAEQPPVGYTGAPIGDPQPLVGKVIDYCMDPSVSQTGTTQFTDGTTGWTQECADQWTS